MISEESFSESSSEESDDSQFDEDDNECGLCGGAFQEGELWLQCDICKKWFHADCTDQRKKGKRHLDKMTYWACESCT